MTADDLGTWEPLDLTEVVALFDGADFRWWISGGHALELHLGRRWRDHDDIDVGVVRSDAVVVHRWLSTAGWDLWLAAAGRLTPWHGSALDAGRSHNNVWVRRPGGGPWNLDLTIGEGDRRMWRYRRDPTVAWPWDRAVLEAPGGRPYLAPELQLLFKSTSVRPKDRLDAEQVIPELTDDGRAFLVDALPPDHEWQELLRRQR